MTFQPEHERPMQEHARFSEPARKAICNAAELARRKNHHLLSSEYVLLGLLSDPTANAVQLIATTADVNKIKFYIKSQMREDNIPSQHNTGVELSPEVRSVVDSAISEARMGNNDAHIGTEHLLFGIIRENQGVATAILKHFKITKEDLGRFREKAKELGEESSQTFNPNQIMDPFSVSR